MVCPLQNVLRRPSFHLHLTSSLPSSHQASEKSSREKEKKKFVITFHLSLIPLPLLLPSSPRHTNYYNGRGREKKRNFSRPTLLPCMKVELIRKEERESGTRCLHRYSSQGPFLPLLPISYPPPPANTNSQRSPFPSRSPAGNTARATTTTEPQSKKKPSPFPSHFGSVQAVVSPSIKST